MKSVSKRKKLALAIFIALLLFNAGCSEGDIPPAGQAPAAIPLTDCRLSAPYVNTRRDAKCGRLEVFEDSQARTGKTIHLHIAVLEARSKNPAPDPLFFLTGGPGQAATESYLSLAGAFGDINRRRDIVLVDQRGTGLSNKLHCDLAEGETESEISDFLEGCLMELEGDPAQYTTTNAMRDLDAVREALGYDRINLYGVSYGTRAALVYLRLYPERVRSLILDGLAPLQLNLGYGMAQDAQGAWERIVARCEAQPGCLDAFPDLGQNFEALMAGLAESPRKLHISHPITGEELEVELTAEMAGMVVRFHSYSPETAALLPLLIHSAQVEGDMAPLAAQFFMNAEQLETSIANAMSYSILCSEDVPFYPPDPPAGKAYLGTTLVDEFQAICEVWPAGEIPQNFHEPVHSDLPVLLLSGAFDPVTPPAYADIAAETLSNNLHLIAPGMGHNVAARGCIPDLMFRFLEDGSHAGLDPECVQNIAPFPFFLQFAGPAP